MADLLTSDGELTWISFPIEKIESTPDGDVEVWGKATDGAVDADEQIVDPDFAAKAIPDWFETGPNVRVQHQPQRDPAGVGIHYERDGDAHWVKSLIVEPVAKELVKKGVLRAYRVGIARPTIVRDGVARGGRITGGQIVEISLVDRPANKNCGIQLVKAAMDGSCEYVGKVFGADILTKDAPGDDDVTVTLPADVSMSFTPNDLARILTKGKVKQHPGDIEHGSMSMAEHSPAMAKRDFDPNVGAHGTDRDKLSDSDFAGRNRSFPIRDASDVSDALQSIGRAGADNYDAATLRANILRIARRKGFQVPKKYRKDKTDKSADFLSDKAIKRRVAALADEMVPHMTKKHKAMCPSCGAKQNMKHAMCSECGKSMEGATPVQKNHDYTCLKCGYSLDKGEKHCPSCGKKNPGYLPEADRKIPANKGEGEPVSTKAGFGHTANPAEGVVGHGDDVMSVPRHREPDGLAVEEFEGSAGLPQDGGATEKNAHRLAKIGAPRDVAAIHDFTCPAFKWDDALKCYPEGLGLIDIGEWQAKAYDIAASAPMEQAGRAIELAQHAVTLKGAAMEDVLEIKSDLNKAFRDANPGPGTFPTPHEMRPADSFRRPYLTGGHSAPSHQQSGPNSAPMSPGHIGAGDFSRTYLTAGHATDSPANTGGHQPVPTPKLEGVPTSVEYRNPLRDAASNAMNAMHAHVAATFPDLCPMTSTDIGPSNGPPPGVDYSSNKVPRNQGLPAAQKSEFRGSLGKKARKKLAKKIRNRMFMENQSKPFGDDDKKKDKGLTNAQLQKTIAATLKERDKKLSQRLQVKGAAKTERAMLARELSDQLAAQIAPIRETLAAQQNVVAAPVTADEAALAQRALQKTVSKALARQDKRDAELNRQLQDIASQAAQPVVPGQPSVTKAQVDKAIGRVIAQQQKHERAMRKQLSDRLSELTAQAAAAGTPAPAQKGITRGAMQKAIDAALDRRDLALAEQLRVQMAQIPAAPKSITKGQVAKTVESILTRRDQALEDRISGQMAQLTLPTPAKGVTKNQVAKAISSALTQRDQALQQRDQALADRLSAQIAQLQQLPVVQKSLTKSQVTKTIDAALAQRDAHISERLNAVVASVGKSRVVRKGMRRGDIQKSIEGALAQRDAQLTDRLNGLAASVAQPRARKNLRRGDIQRTIKDELRRRDEKFSDQRLIEQLVNKQHQSGPGPSPTAGASSIKQQLKKERKRLVKKLRKRMMKQMAKTQGRVPEPPTTTPPPSVPAQKGASKAQVEKAIDAALSRQEAALAAQRNHEMSASEREYLSKQLSYEISERISRLIPQQRAEPIRTYTPIQSVPAPKSFSAADVTKMIKKQLAQQNKINAKLIQKKIKPVERAVFALADQPDPATQAFKGQAMNGFRLGATRSPVGVQAADSAERTQQMMLQELEDQFRNSPDPAQREAAWRAITKMRGLSE